MKENIFWDKKMSIDDVKNILRDESHERFIYFASLLLSRTNQINKVLTDYLDKVTFCRNWRKIKQKMRKDKWNDPRINYWEEVYKVVVKEIGSSKKQVFPKRDKFENQELMGLANSIRKVRKEKGWTQQKLAKHIGLSQQTISFIEKGNFNFSFRSFIKIVHALNFRISLKPKDEFPNSTDTSSPNYTSFTDISTKCD